MINVSHILCPVDLSPLSRSEVGLAADLIVFDYRQLTDRATFAEPNRLAEGMKYVIVNGELVVDEGAHTGARPGRALRRRAAKPSG